MKKLFLLLTLGLVSCSVQPTISSEPASSLGPSSSDAYSSIPSSRDVSSEPFSSEEPSSEIISSEPISSEVISSEEPSSEVLSSEPSSEVIISSSEDSFDFPSYSEAPSEQTESSGTGPILHAWDWSLSQISNNLDKIKNAGFKTIQLSPLQPSKDINAGSRWWNLYQPLGYSVATGNQNPLGNKSSLKSLTEKAQEKGIDIIVDVVCNHLAQGNYGEFMTWGGDYSGNKTVRDFESYIVDNNLHHDPNLSTNDNSVKNVVQGSLGGLPDVCTENNKVQERVISMLKEYIDCGVKGFRFDAAKHIETPDDGDFKSNFWPNVLNNTKEYASSKYDFEPFVYGEILYTPGAGRQWSSYTKMMSVTDNVQGKDILFAVNDRNAGNASSSHINIGDASKAVLWAESHDTYGNDNNNGGYTYAINADVVNLTYAIQISRKDATALYFARPQSNYGQGGCPQVISGACSDYYSALITGANMFHNDFINGSEKLFNSDDCVINVRKNSDGSNSGALIASPKFASSVNLTINDLEDGTYTDVVSNKKVTVTNHKVNTSLTKGAAILIKNPGASAGPVGPEIDITADKTIFSDKAHVEISCPTASICYYQINAGNKVKFIQNASFDIDESYPDGDYVITVYAADEEKQVTSHNTISLYKTKTVDFDIVVPNVPESATVLAWVWSTAADSHWIDLERYGSTLVANLNGEACIIFVGFPEGVTSKTADWNSKLWQTHDLSTSAHTYDISQYLEN